MRSAVNPPPPPCHRDGPAAADPLGSPWRLTGSNVVGATSFLPAVPPRPPALTWTFRHDRQLELLAAQARTTICAGSQHRQR